MQLSGIQQATLLDVLVDALKDRLCELVLGQQLIYGLHFQTSRMAMVE